MEDQNQFVSTKKLLESASSVIVILPPDPSLDMVAAGLSLHLSMKAAGKKSQIGSGTEVHVDPKIQGAQEISDSIGARNLVISFDYHEDDLEKVDYDVHSDGKFYLMVKPKEGAPVPDVSNVKYSYSGANADLVVTFGINSLEELGKIYADEKKFLDEAKILSLNITPKPATFTQNLLHLNFTSFSELVTILMEKAGIKPTQEAASNLLTFIHEETKGLTSPRMTADTFTGIAYLMRHGARLPNQQAFVPRLSQPSFFEAPSAPVPSTPDEESIPMPSEENGPVPQDWTKPKIFRASDL